MRLASFVRDGHAGFGVVRDDHLLDLTGQAPSLRAAIAHWGLDGLRQRAETARRVALAGLAWLPPITDPDKILCVGLNYHEHAREAKMAIPERPSLFVRFASSQVGHEAPVVRPRASPKFDYEAELAVVIGKAGRHIGEARALDHVAGYGCFAENSVRDWQTHSRQATPGKNFEGSGAFGPWLVTPDEAGPVEQMEIIGRLNGREMQRDSAANMIFSVPQQIAYISTFTTLLPGDVIVTGTPAGVGFTRNPPVWLTPGDRFEVEIGGVGVLSNPVIDEPAQEGA
jgi:2-keto-4-pentenoate hydratase/2-oxohepta-3-ene-1,7-dioic acid hydratase in catechol pathway